MTRFTDVAPRLPIALRPLLAAAAAGSLLAGCSTITARGVVRDPGGKPIPDAVVRVTAARGGKLALATKADANGCFNASDFAPRGERELTIEVSAAGSRAAISGFSLRANTPILWATLASDSAGESSELRPMSSSEHNAVWEPICAPAIPRAASSLGPS
jgi:hypothetical protein